MAPGIGGRGFGGVSISNVLDGHWMPTVDSLRRDTFGVELGRDVAGELSGGQ